MSTSRRRVAHRAGVASLLAVGSLVVAVALSHGPSGAAPKADDRRLAPIEQDLGGDTVAVYDSGVGATVTVDRADLEHQLQALSQAPGEYDEDGNPRFVLLWRNGQLVNGPALTCTPPSDDGAPATCSPTG